MNNVNPTTVSVGAGVGHRSASGDASFGTGSSLSSLQNEHSNALSNDALHNGIDACSEDACIDQALSDDTLSTLDNDTIMNDSGDLLEFDFDSEIQPLGMDHQASMATDIKMLRKGLFEATRLSITMLEDGTLASNAGALKRQLIMAKENYDLLFDDTPMLSPSMAYSNAANSIVPPDTLYIQWKGHKFNNKKFVYPTINACLQQFQDVLESLGVSTKANWKRIIKPKMSTGMSAWTREIIQKYPEITWGQFKSKLKVKYSPSEAEERKAALNKLKTLKLDNCDNLEDFIDRFNSLKDLAGVKENTSLVDYLLCGLDIDLYGPVSMGISQARSKGSDTLDFAISQLRSAYDLLRRDDYYRQEKQRKDAELNNTIKDAIKAHQRDEGSASLSNKKTRRAGRHHDKQSRKKRNDSPGEVLKCYDCGFTPFTYAHKALCKKNPKNIKKITKKKSKLIVPRPASNDDIDSSSSDEESDQTFAAATISTKDKQKEEVVSMDTDSEFYQASNSTVVNKNGTKLAQSNTVVNRKGQSEEELKINYGSKVVYSKFEVFDLFDDVHCVFGMDLLYKVGITLGNIAADWSDRIGYEIPDVKHKE